MDAGLGGVDGYVGMGGMRGAGLGGVDEVVHGVGAGQQRVGPVLQLVRLRVMTVTV